MNEKESELVEQSDSLPNKEEEDDDEFIRMRTTGGSAES